MPKRLFIPIRIAVLIILAALTALAQNHYLVRLSGGGNINSVANRHNMQLVASLSGSASGMYVLNSAQGPSSILSVLVSDPAVLDAEYDAPTALPEVSKGSVNPSQNLSAVGSAIAPYLNKFQSNPFTGASEWSAYVNQPAAGIIQIPAAHQLASGSGTIAILDTGIDFTHPVLAQSVIPGWDFIDNIPGGFATPYDISSLSNLSQSDPAILDQSTTPILDDDSSLVLNQSTTPILDQSTTPILDHCNGPALAQSTTPILDGVPTCQPTNDYGHGTMVAGIVHLVAPTAKLMPVKVFDDNGGSSLSLIIAGIYYAADHGASVINMSFSTLQPSNELQTAINAAHAKGIIVVAAAGNEGEDITVFPAGDNQVMGVGSTSNQNIRSTFSNYGPVVALAAPGEGIITTYPQNMYAAGWGTSFSAPMVAGAAALLLQLDPQANEGKASEALSQNTTAIGQQQFLGAGLLNLYLALGSIKGGH